MASTNNNSNAAIVATRELRNAARANDSAAVQRWLSDPALVPELDAFGAASEAACSNSALALSALLMDARYNTTQTWFQALEAACNLDASDAFRALLAHLPPHSSSLAQLAREHKGEVAHAFLLSATTPLGNPPTVLPLFFDLLEPAHADFDRMLHARSAFKHACRRGAIGAVRLMMTDARFCIDPSARGNVALHAACSQDNPQSNVVRELLADPRVDPCVDDRVLLLRACESGSLDLLEALCSTGRMDLSEPFRNGSTPLSVAAKRGADDIVACILRDARFRISDDNAVRAVIQCVQNNGPDRAGAFSARFGCLAHLLGSSQIRDALARKRRVRVSASDCDLMQRISDVLFEIVW